MKRSRFEAAALGYAELGYHVFPCKPREKVPLTKRGWQDASRDERQILQWWDRWPNANIGIACGLSGAAVLDIDSKHGADPREVIAQLALDDYPTIWTGEAPDPCDEFPNSLAGVRGAQIPFRADLPTRETTIPGVEIRGAGAYVVAPPSVHPSGVPYEGTWPAVPELPRDPGLDSILSEAAGRAAMAPTDDEVLDQGGRHEALLAWATSRLTAHGILDGIALDAMLGHNLRVCRPPLEDDEVRRLWRHLERTRIAASERAKTNGKVEPLTISARDVRSRVMRWLWIGRLAHGYLSVTTGLEKIGKSLFWCWVIARLTRGTLDGGPDAPVDVLILAREDGIEDTWKPRLAVAGAALERCHFVRFEALGKVWNLRDGAGRLREAVNLTSARLLLIDAVLDHLPEPGHGESINSATFVRNSISPLVEMLREASISGVISMHPPKGAQGSEFRDLVQSSQAWVAVCRLGLLVAPHPEDEEVAEDERRRVVLRGVGNRGRNPGGLEFRTGEQPHLHDDGETQACELVVDVIPSSVTMRDLRRSDPANKVNIAVQLMRAVLADGEWRDSKQVYAVLDAAEVGAKQTVVDARKKAGVETRKAGFESGWQWRMPDPSQASRARKLNASDSSDPTTTTNTCKEEVFTKNLGSEREGSEATTEGSEGSGGHLTARARAGATERYRTHEEYRAWERRRLGERDDDD